jgi:hypothetical protein
LFSSVDHLYIVLIFKEAEADCKRMIFSMPIYEFRYHGEQDWEDISEIDLMQRLHETYERVTPAIQQLLEGKQLLTADTVYRLKNNKMDKVSK